VGHSNQAVYDHLNKLIMTVLLEYPKQALWLFASVTKSTKPTRGARARAILDKLRVCIESCCTALANFGWSQNNPVHATTEIPSLITQTIAMINELLALCDHHISDDSKKTLTMGKDFPKLAKLGRSRLLIPLQESLHASLPPNSSSRSVHQPFPPNAPLFESWS
jgi:serine/threonine-protein kinase ATR